MGSIRKALARLSTLVRGHTVPDRSLREEMESHLEMEIEENVRRGLPPDEARRRALVASGGLAQAAERVRAQRGVPWVESVGADVRYALRHFRRTPLATITMVLVLSLGIGTTVVLFTVLNSVATMPAPGIERDAALVRIRGSMRTPRLAGLHPRFLSWTEVQAYAGRTDLFSSVAAYADETGVLVAGDAADAPITTRIIFATANYLPILGVRPVIGTGPVAESEVTRLTAMPTAMISHAMWTQKLGGAADIVGRMVRINDVAVEIVGVAPPRFVGADGGPAMTAWVHLAAYPVLQKSSTAAFTSPDSAFLRAAARLQPGLTPGAASPIAAAIARRASAPREVTGSAAAPGALVEVETSADVVPLLARNDRVSDGRRADMIVSGVASGGLAMLVLLITCTNVSALLVGLAVARRREIGVRLSLGAPRARLIRQLLTETIMLSLLAAAVGLVVTVAGIEVIGTALDDVQLVVDWRVTTATCAVAIITGLLFGLSPALHATRVPVGEVLKNSASSVAGGRSRLQRALVVTQIALTQPLLVGLGVVIATMSADVRSLATSAMPDRIAEIELDTWAGRVSNEERAGRIAAVVERVAAMPGVVAALPMQLGTVTAFFTVHPADRVSGIAYGPSMETQLTAAPEGYFRAYGIPILRGRDFTGGERVPLSLDAGVAPSFDRVIIGSDLARRLWGDADPLGRRFVTALSRPSESSTMVVVGVVDAGAAGPSDADDKVRVYVPYSVINTGVIARTAGPALPLLNAMRRVAETEAPQMPVARAETMEQREERSRLAVLRTSAAIAGGGLLALLLSAIGLYAVVSLAVGQRTREIGIRSALGAQQHQVIRLFFTNGLSLSALGLLLGLPLSAAVVRLVEHTLDWPMTSPPLLGVAVGSVVLVVASIAVWIPARRASTIDPVVALRD